MNISDTIIAQATPLGYSGVSIIRMSGPSSISIIKKLTKTKKLEPREATLKKIVSNNNDIVDDVHDITSLKFGGLNSHVSKKLKNDCFRIV